MVFDPFSSTVILGALAQVGEYALKLHDDANLARGPLWDRVQHALEGVAACTRITRGLIVAAEDTEVYDFEELQSPLKELMEAQNRATAELNKYQPLHRPTYLGALLHNESQCSHDLPDIAKKLEDLHTALNNQFLSFQAHLLLRIAVIVDDKSQRPLSNSTDTVGHIFDLYPFALSTKQENGILKKYSRWLKKNLGSENILSALNPVASNDRGEGWVGQRREWYGRRHSDCDALLRVQEDLYGRILSTILRTNPSDTKSSSDTDTSPDAEESPSTKVLQRVQLLLSKPTFEHYRFTVAIVGKVSVGKSTVVNNIMGHQILPNGFSAETAITTRIRHDPSALEPLLTYDVSSYRLVLEMLVSKKPVLEEARESVLSATSYDSDDDQFVQPEGHRENASPLTSLFLDQGKRRSGEMLDFLRDFQDGTKQLSNSPVRGVDNIRQTLEVVNYAIRFCRVLELTSAVHESQWPTVTVNCEGLVAGAKNYTGIEFLDTPGLGEASSLNEFIRQEISLALSKSNVVIPVISLAAARSGKESYADLKDISAPAMRRKAGLVLCTFLDHTEGEDSEDIEGIRQALSEQFWKPLRLILPCSAFKGFVAEQLLPTVKDITNEIYKPTWQDFVAASGRGAANNLRSVITKPVFDRSTSSQIASDLRTMIEDSGMRTALESFTTIVLPNARARELVDDLRDLCELLTLYLGQRATFVAATQQGVRALEEILKRLPKAQENVIKVVLEWRRDQFNRKTEVFKLLESTLSKELRQGQAADVVAEAVKTFANELRQKPKGKFKLLSKDKLTSKFEGVKGNGPWITYPHSKANDLAAILNRRAATALKNNDQLLQKPVKVRLIGMAAAWKDQLRTAIAEARRDAITLPPSFSQQKSAQKFLADVQKFIIELIDQQNDFWNFEPSVPLDIGLDSDLHLTLGVTEKDNFERRGTELLGSDLYDIVRPFRFLYCVINDGVKRRQVVSLEEAINATTARVLSSIKNGRDIPSSSITDYMCYDIDTALTATMRMDTIDVQEIRRALLEKLRAGVQMTEEELFELKLEVSNLHSCLGALRLLPIYLREALRKNDSGENVM